MDGRMTIPSDLRRRLETGKRNTSPGTTNAVQSRRRAGRHFGSNFTSDYSTYELYPYFWISARFAGHLSEIRKPTIGQAAGIRAFYRLNTA